MFIVGIDIAKRNHEVAVITPEGQVVFNEVNTIPGFTAHSRYPAMMAGIGLDFPALLDRLIGLAVAP